MWWGPGSALAGPGQGQGHLRVDRTSRARARAGKIGRGPARTDPWTVYGEEGAEAIAEYGAVIDVFYNWLYIVGIYFFWIKQIKQRSISVPLIKFITIRKNLPIGLFLPALDPFYLHITLTLVDVTHNSYLADLAIHIVVLYCLGLQL